jgi:predicted nucleotidyltransferase component of viral defense system
MDDKIIATIAAGTNLAPEDIQYEVDMTELSGKLFDFLKSENVKVYLFGGTALNKGFFGERQRLSRDLDIEVDKSQPFKKTILKFESCLIKAGYSNIRVNENKMSYTIYVSEMGKSREIKIDLVQQQNKIKPVPLTLHSLLEYNGIPIKTVNVMSYPFEYLLAYKLNALARRMIYKDIYDSYTGLRLKFDRPTLVHYATLFDVNGQLFNNIIRNIEDGEYDKKDESGYGKLVQERYRVPLQDMLYDIRARLEISRQGL